MQHLMVSSKGGLTWAALEEWTWGEMCEQSDANAALVRLYREAAKGR